MQFKNLLDLQLMMFLYIAIGAFLRRKNIITSQGKAMLTDLIIDLLLPCSIISSFDMAPTKETWSSYLLVIAVSTGIQLFCMVISAFCYKWVDKPQRMVFQYGTVCSNASFLGGAVAESLYGPLGMVYSAIYLIPQRIVMWTAGVSYFTDLPDKREVLKRLVTHPCILAAVLGILRMALAIPLPVFLDKGMRSLGACTTPLALIFIGTVVAEVGVRSMVDRKSLLFCAIRLIGIPMVVYIFCMLLQLDSVISGVCVALAAMPAGSTTAIMAAKYHGNEAFAAQCIVLSTLISMALLPLWAILISLGF